MKKKKYAKNPNSEALRDMIIEFHTMEGKPSKYWITQLKDRLQKADAKTLVNTWKYIQRLRKRK